MKAYKGRGVRIVYDVVRDGGATLSEAIHTASDFAGVVRQLQEAGRLPLEREAFMVFALDSKHRTIAFQAVSIGNLDAAPVHPREVFRFAVAVGAAALLVAHNHPSGDPTPSTDDRLVTDRLRTAGEVLGISLLDHLVIGADSFWSFDGGRAQPMRARPSSEGRP